MREPKRLLKDGASDFERQLLRSVMNERPSARHRSRMLRGLGFVGPLAWASQVKAALSGLGSQATAGIAVGGVLAAGAVVAASWAPWGDAAGPERASPARAAAPAQQELAAPARAPEPTPQVAPVRAESPALETPPGDRADTQLRDEIALLDRARVALQKGQRKRALQALEQYRQRHPAGILERESELLRGQASARKPSRGQRHAP